MAEDNYFTISLLRKSFLDLHQLRYNEQLSAKNGFFQPDIWYDTDKTWELEDYKRRL